MAAVDVGASRPQGGSSSPVPLLWAIPAPLAMWPLDRSLELDFDTDEFGPWISSTASPMVLSGGPGGRADPSPGGGDATGTEELSEKPDDAPKTYSLTTEVSIVSEQNPGAPAGSKDSLSSEEEPAPDFPIIDTAVPVREGFVGYRLTPSLFPGRAPTLRFTSICGAPSSAAPEEGTIHYEKKDDDARKGFYRISRVPAHAMLVNTFKRAGLQSTRGDSWNILWGARLKEEEYTTLNPFQRINHFPGTWNIGRKDHLFRRLQKMRRQHGSEHFKFVPQTFFLPSDYQLLADALKPAAAAGPRVGRGPA
eukprot:RCo004735